MTMSCMSSERFTERPMLPLGAYTMSLRRMVKSLRLKLQLISPSRQRMKAENWSMRGSWREMLS